MLSWLWGDQKHDEQKEKLRQIPEEFKDPITKKIMAQPTMILSSLKIYDACTIKYWIDSKRYYDPLTGIPMSVAGYPLLLYPRDDIKNKITQFLAKYPSKKTQLFRENDKSIQWKSLFKLHETRVKHKFEIIKKNQEDLKFRAKPIFRKLRLDENGIGIELVEDDEKRKKKDTENDIGIEYDTSVILLSDIPVICFMGPSRNGKSTIVNDILGVKNACIVSQRSNVAQTKGGWIAKYCKYEQSKAFNEGNVYQIDGSVTNDEEDEKNEFEVLEEKQQVGDEFYLLDMEGLSHNVTKFTKRLFYACYATSNIVIWNDKEVMSDRFVDLMEELKQEMKAVAASDQKPLFMYLKRDAGDFKHKPYGSFTEYINKDESFEWFREMNIFSSITAYELPRPFPNENDEDEALNFSTMKKNRLLLAPLIDKLISISRESKRFASNTYILQQQIEHINRSTALSLTSKLISENKILSQFQIAPNGPQRRRDMVYVACRFEWDHAKLEKMFNEEMQKLTQQHDGKLSEKVLNRLMETKNEIYERIKNKADAKSYGTTFGLMGSSAGGGSVLAGSVMYAAGTGAAMLTGPVVVGIFVAAGLGYMAGWTTGKTAEYVEKGYKKFTQGNYVKYTLGKTDEEIKMDKEKIKSKSNFNRWGEYFKYSKQK
eukprot:460548_1